MAGFTDSARVREQYRSSAQLETRISIHEKYSQNPVSFAEWLFSQYELRPGDAILELGCGTGAMWRSAARRLPKGCRLLLTDLSAGMVERARATLEEVPGVDFACADIQALPYADGSMDVVIANMMLYHVPDLERALSEVRRVLRPRGRFYCATYGVNGIGRFIGEALGDLGITFVEPDGFTLQNGGAKLSAHFASVERRDYTDELRVTDARDLVRYVRSLGGISYRRELADAELLARLNARARDGAIRVPKEYGLFAARKG